MRGRKNWKKWNWRLEWNINLHCGFRGVYSIGFWYSISFWERVKQSTGKGEWIPNHISAFTCAQGSLLPSPSLGHFIPNAVNLLPGRMFYLSLQCSWCFRSTIPPLMLPPVWPGTLIIWQMWGKPGNMSFALWWWWWWLQKQQQTLQWGHGNEKTAKCSEEFRFSGTVWGKEEKECDDELARRRSVCQSGTVPEVATKWKRWMELNCIFIEVWLNIQTWFNVGARLTLDLFSDWENVGWESIFKGPTLRSSLRMGGFILSYTIYSLLCVLEWICLNLINSLRINEWSRKLLHDVSLSCSSNRKQKQQVLVVQSVV